MNTYEKYCVWKKAAVTFIDQNELNKTVCDGAKQCDNFDCMWKQQETHGALNGFGEDFTE